MKAVEQKCKSVAFCTLGCKVNQYETDLMKKKFVDDGYIIVDFDSNADIYVINSCSVTNIATRKTRQYISRAKKNNKIVVLVGCYAEEIKEKIQIKNVDIVIGNNKKDQIIKYVNKYLKNLENNNNDTLYIASDINNVKKYSQIGNLECGINVRESVKIEDGCNNFCSYCIIPYLRGRVRSRNIDDIINEVKSLAKSGVGEIVLVGIEIASYGKDLDNDISLIDVIEKVTQVEDVKRVRIGSLEPRILTDENIIRLSKIQKLCPHFHISVQSLDSRVLSRMNRKYDRDFLLNRVKKLKEHIKDVAITCDIIVGFPGETDEEFKNTISGVEEIEFYEVHAFKYSKRKWTKAERMQNQVDGNIANKRSQDLIDIASKYKKLYMEKYIGKKMRILVESYKNGYLYGYTPNYIKVKVRGDKKLWGQEIEVELEIIEKDLILGKLLT